MNRKAVLTIGIIGVVLGIVVLCTGATKAAKAKDVLEAYRAVEAYSGRYSSHDSEREALQSARITMSVGGGIIAVFGLFTLIGACMKTETKTVKPPANLPIQNVLPQENMDSRNSLSAKLNELNRARDAGLISEEEYAQKRKDILDNW